MSAVPLVGSLLNPIGKLFASTAAPVVAGKKAIDAVGEYIKNAVTPEAPPAPSPAAQTAPPPPPTPEVPPNPTPSDVDNANKTNENLERAAKVQRKIRGRAANVLNVGGGRGLTTQPPMASRTLMGV